MNTNYTDAASTSGELENHHETVIEQKARKRKEAEVARKRKFAEIFAKVKLFFQKISLKFWLTFFDRLVQRASRKTEELSQVLERKEELITDAEAESRATKFRELRRQACAVIFVALAASLLDITLVLSNIAYALASRLAGGAEPALWEKVCAFGAIEIALLVVLLTVKSLADTRGPAHQLATTTKLSEFNAARSRLWGARFACAAYLVLITFAFGLNILAEVGKQDAALEMWHTLRNSMALDAGAVAVESLPADAEGGHAIASRIPITAGVSVLIWALHVAVLFMPPGKFGFRGIWEMTKTEVERRYHKLTVALNALLLKINAKLQSAEGNSEMHAAMLNRIPENVKLWLDRLMGAKNAPETSSASAIAPIIESPNDVNTADASLFVFRPLSKLPPHDSDAASA